MSEKEIITSKIEIDKETWENISDLIEKFDNSRKYSKKYKVEKAFELLDHLKQEWLKDSLENVSVVEAERRIAKLKKILRD